VEERSFIRNTNGMANGPKTAPIIAQNFVLAPRLFAICQRRNAHPIHIMEMVIIPIILYCLLVVSKNRMLEIVENIPRKYRVALFLDWVYKLSEMPFHLFEILMTAAPTSPTTAA
jgi:hypothetical protein